jgi:hypothetical protein
MNRDIDLASEHLPHVFLDNKYLMAGFGLVLLFHANQAICCKQQRFAIAEHFHTVFV